MGLFRRAGKKMEDGKTSSGFFVWESNWRNLTYGRPYVVIILGVVVLALSMFVLSRLPPKKTTYFTNPKEIAWSTCTQAVEEQTGVPASDADEFSPIKVTLLSEDHYQMDVRYAKENASYRCEVKAASNGDWQLISVRMK